jgi:hypothetical protein
MPCSLARATDRTSRTFLISIEFFLFFKRKTMFSKNGCRWCNEWVYVTSHSVRFSFLFFFKFVILARRWTCHSLFGLFWFWTHLSFISRLSFIIASRLHSTAPPFNVGRKQQIGKQTQTPTSVDIREWKEWQREREKSCRSDFIKKYFPALCGSLTTVSDVVVI